MSKKKKADKDDGTGHSAIPRPEKMPTKVYEKEIARLQEELAQLQAWVIPPISDGVQSQNLRCHFQFLCGCDAANAHVRAVVVVRQAYQSR